jgi:hypothetical protein
MGSAGAGHEEMDTAVRFQMLHLMVVPAEVDVCSVAKDREQMLERAASCLRAARPSRLARSLA